ncbi:hypothetical protein GCM10023149_48340 [Mucilaginibacter gynuensis]|uniref:HTH tetR-type domain-containing protein n=1 Tax=Mucilaginibacter gynuensis TaxID=1302236 RepID=A0ABP8HEV0_9SPHI
MRTRNTDKEQLVKQTAIELLVNDGFEGFSMNKLAKACGISVATLYIYYKDKDDLIIKIGTEEYRLMCEQILENFNPEVGFEEGLRHQWKNRVRHALRSPVLGAFFEQLRSSTYQQEIYEVFVDEFKETMGRFMHNAIKRGEINAMPLEVYWAIAFGPLYNLLRFHQEGRSIGGRAFILTDEMIWQAFALVIKALKN